MIAKLNLLGKYLNLLLIILIPTQLALHFWPDFSLVFGIRVDYLSPTIYLTDILFIFLFLPWAVNSKVKILKDIKKNYKFLILLFAVCAINILLSSSLFISLLKWAKVIELILFGYYIKSRGDVFSVKNIGAALFYSLLFFSLIGVAQFVRGGTSGSLFYLVGERSFSIFTPGIALVNLFGKNCLRVYSTFPHPNSFAGFLGVSILFFIFSFSRPKKNILFFFAPFLIIFSVFVLTFSLSAYIGLLTCGILYIFFKKHLFNKSVYNFLIFSVLIFSLCFAFFSKPLLNNKTNFSKSFSERLELGNISGRIFSENWLFGTGLNTFIPEEISFASSERSVWLLQPVHNIYLLIFAESGILGIFLLSFLFYQLSKNIIRTKNMWGALIIVFVLITGLFDHYWFTSQQNMFLLSILFGISFREVIN